MRFNSMIVFRTSMVLAIALAGVSVSAQVTAEKVASSVSDADRAFMTEAATGGLAEVELGRLAARKGKSASVRAFGQRMVRDHSRANVQLKSLARSKRVALPAALTEEQKADRAKLQNLSGADFDREYMSMMVDDHDKDVAAFQDKSSSASDAGLRAFATKTLPTLQQHQKMAHDIKDKM